MLLKHQLSEELERVFGNYNAFCTTEWRTIIIYRFSLKAELAFFFPHVSRAQHLAPARTTDHWTAGQSHGIGVPAVQLTTHVKSCTLNGRTSKFFRLDGLLLFCKIMGLHFASSSITSQTNLTTINVYLWAPSSFYNHNQVAVPAVSFCGAEKKIRRNVSLLSAKYYKFD